MPVCIQTCIASTDHAKINKKRVVSIRLEMLRMCRMSDHWFSKYSISRLEERMGQGLVRGGEKKRICGFAIRSDRDIEEGYRRRKNTTKGADGTRRTDTATEWLIR